MSCSADSRRVCHHAVKALPLFALAALFFLASCAGSPEAVTHPSEHSDEQRAKDLVQGEPGFTPAQPLPAQPQPGSETPKDTGSAQLLPGMNAEESAYLRKYLSRLSYMVYYNDKAAGADPRFAHIAVFQANRYLIEKQGLTVIDFEQIEKNKQDQQAAYITETGGSIDVIHYLAQKFNADVYLEIDYSLSCEARLGNYYASAQGAVKIFDVSTAVLLGSVTFISQPAFSPSSADAAMTNALAASIWSAMPKVTEQARALELASLSRGIRYEIILQRTPDSRQVSRFRQALAARLKEVEQASYAAGETRIYAFAFAGRDKVEDAVYAAAAASGMPGINLLYSRGKSFTFTTGL